MNINNLAKKWTREDIDEISLLKAFTKVKDFKLENQLMICIWLSDLAIELDEDGKLDEDHKSYSFHKINKRMVMDKLKATRFKIDNALSYLEGADLITIDKRHTLEMKLTTVGNSYMSLFMKTQNGDKLFNNLTK
ncbi:MAG: hypothetical protein JEZ08_22525 [Clostridiales bacterium]|nr:hypothetical protein [Clostridiales bacterium]